jgi:uncharacterized membrane protein
MRGYQMTSTIGRVAGLGVLGALMFTYACGGAKGPMGTRASLPQDTASQGGAPVIVTCEPNQRTFVRPAVVNGAAVSQVECVSVGQAYASAESVQAVQQPVAVPVQYRYNTAPAPQVRQAVYDDRELADTRVIPVSSTPRVSAARPVRAEQIVYDDRPVRTVRRAPVRSAKKSAVIIGSSAGAAAGIGAAIGGKKGTLIGAVLGGGGATVWDQITRRRN